ncbi:MAG: amino acid ABC transporter permease [Clostridia bacterium]|nr:amino acid ABC transporter permease [Clostridia bacterium]
MNFWQSLYDGFHTNIIVSDRWFLLLKGLGITLEISLFAVIIGVVLGVILALAKISKSRNFIIVFFRWISNVFIDVIRGTPSFVQLLIINFVVFASVDIDKTIVASIAFGLNSAAYIAEIIRAGIQSINKGQTEAGRSLGLSEGLTMRYIILPQAIKNILPALGNEFIVLVKETSVAGYIGAYELTKASQIITSRTYNSFWPLFAIAVIYFVVVKLLSVALAALENKLGKSDAR